MIFGIGISLQIRESFILGIFLKEINHRDRDDYQLSIKIFFIWLVITIAVPFLEEDHNERYY